MTLRQRLTLRYGVPLVQKYIPDWANFERYRDANAQLAPPTPGEPRVVFMGDSITEGWMSWPGAFFPGKPYVNRGINGQTTPQMLVRFRPDVIALQPRLTVIQGGSNDIARNPAPGTLEEIVWNLASMADLAHANGIRVVLGSHLPVTDAILPQTNRRRPEKILALNVRIKSYAQAQGIVYLDYFPAMLGGDGMLRKELTFDGLHPNAAGYAVMSPLAEKAIEEALR